MRVADVLADDAGAQAGDLRPLREIHLRSRRSSPSASNRSSPPGAAPTARQANRWSPRSAALRALPDGPPATVCKDGRLHGTALRGGSWSAWLGSDRGMAVRAQAQWIALSAV